MFSNSKLVSFPRSNCWRRCEAFRLSVFGKDLLIKPVVNKSRLVDVICPAELDVPHFVSTHGLPKNKKIVFIEPHPDDTAIGAGNLAKRLAASGNQVTLISAISDHLGVSLDYRPADDPDYSPTVEARALIREKESAAYAAAAGCQFISLRMNFPFQDASLAYDQNGKLLSYFSAFGHPGEEDRDKLLQALLVLDPDWIFMPFIDDLHQHHRDVSALAVSASHELMTQQPSFRSGLRTYFYPSISSWPGAVQSINSFVNGINLVNFLSEEEYEEKYSSFDSAYQSQIQRNRDSGQQSYSVKLDGLSMISAAEAKRILSDINSFIAFGIFRSLSYAEIFLGFTVTEQPAPPID